MKFSEAIRTGAKLRHQTRYTFFGLNSSCAVGAAIEAVDATKFGVNFDFMSAYLFLKDHGVELTQRVLQNAITMNDETFYSREAIADWVESQGY